jgi:hypothetical protein
MTETPTADDLYERLLQSLIDARAERDDRRARADVEYREDRPAVPETPTPADAPIPAVWCIGDCDCPRHVAERAEVEQLRRGTNVAKAAELRRIAEIGLRGRSSDAEDLLAELRARADELDPPARQEN